MSKTLREVAEQLKTTDKKVQLIYAFNGTGKTRLSREFSGLMAEDIASTDDAIVEADLSRKNILYYNAFTEDLFYWDNDLTGDENRKLQIRPNAFTKWVLEDQGQESAIVKHFQRLTNSSIEPKFSPDFSAISFLLNPEQSAAPLSIKISKGEESNLIWSIFYSLLEQVIFELNIPDADNRSTSVFNNLKYIFIDDPVSSLDENHLIQLAIDLAELINSSETPRGGGLKFIITTHNPLFYNVLYNEIGLNKAKKKDGCYLLERDDDNRYRLNVKHGDSNGSFAYHLHIKQIIETAIKNNQVERYHFTLLRNLYEKTASFLGYKKWGDLLDTAKGEKSAYLNRIIQFTSHSSLSNETVAVPNPQEKQMVKYLLDNLIDNYSYWKPEKQND